MVQFEKHGSIYNPTFLHFFHSYCVSLLSLCFSQTVFLCFFMFFQTRQIYENLAKDKFENR